MKKHSIIVLIIAILTISIAMLAGCSSFEENPFGKKEVVYISDKGAVIATITEREYIKTNNGVAAIGFAYIDGYTGPVLIGSSANDVEFSYTFSEKNYDIKSAGSFVLKEKKYYYSSNSGFIEGNQIKSLNKSKIYCCKANKLLDAAKEIAGLVNESKFVRETITTVEELKALANTDSKVNLGANIDLSAETNWTPIAGFTGLLDGAGFSISNLKINETNAQDIGLFGSTSGTILNLKLENVVITARGEATNIGALAGNFTGMADSVVTSGSINTRYSNFVGGIVGNATSGSIKNCTNNIEVLANENVGGIVGSFTVSSDNCLSNNTNNAVLIGKKYVGGIAGYLSSSGKKVLDKNINKGSISSTGDYVGGVFGYLSGSIEITSSVNEGKINGRDYTGGIIGYASSQLLISISENKNDIVGGNYTGGYVGFMSAGTLSILQNDYNISGKAYVGGIVGKGTNIESCINNAEIISTQIISENDKNCAYVGGIAGYASQISFCENNANIEVTTGGRYVGGLAGYLVKGEYCKDNTNSGNVTGAAYVGGIAGYSGGAISENLINNNAVSASGDYAAGIYGYASAGEITLCKNHGNITGKNYTSSMVGGGTLKSLSVCDNYGLIVGENYVGGFVGDVIGKMSFLENNVVIVGNGYVGGIAGKTTELIGCKNNGQIISTIGIIENSVCAYVGGIAGYCKSIDTSTSNVEILVEYSGRYVGGYAGYISGGVSELKNIVNVTSNGSFVGGIAGYIGGKVDYCTNEGNISGKDYVAGIAGEYTGSELSFNENSGVVVGSERIGGIVGGIEKHNSVVKALNNSNSNKVSGKKYVGGILGYYKCSMNEHAGDSQFVGNENFGEIVADKFAGGILGSLDTKVYEYKWIQRYNSRICFSLNKNEGTVTAKDSHASGIVSHVNSSIASGWYSGYYITITPYLYENTNLGVINAPMYSGEECGDEVGDVEHYAPQ